jgi:pimeloyl-ACP methyl ester carboxylesterase
VGAPFPFAGAELTPAARRLLAVEHGRVQRDGQDQPVEVLGGQQRVHAQHAPATELARDLTVVNYDRRGRGDSGDTAPHSVEREVDDLSALVEVVGGRASMYGHSSGAVLALHSAARGLPIDRLVLHEPPFGSGSDEERRTAHEEAEHLAALLAQDRRSDAVRFYFASMGMPAEVADDLAADPSMQAGAPPILYDYEILGDHGRDGLTPDEQAGRVSVPALVLAGGASPDFMLDAATRIAAALPHGRLRVLGGEEHVVAPECLRLCWRSSCWVTAASVSARSARSLMHC